MMMMGFQQRREPEAAGETEPQRLDAEASMLAVAEADLEAGRVLSDGDAWLNAWSQGEDVLLPEAAPTR